MIYRRGPRLLGLVEMENELNIFETMDTLSIACKADMALLQHTGECELPSYQICTSAVT